MAGTGIGTFNDRLRDAVRGGGPFDGDPRMQGFGSGLYTDPNGDAGQRDPGRAEGRAAAGPGPDQGRLDRQPADYRFVDRTGATVTGAQVDYNGAPAGYTAEPQEVDQLRRRPRQRDPLRRSGVQAADRHLDGRPGPDADPGAGHHGAWPGRVLLARRRRRCCAASRWTATATTPATGSTCSTSPDRPTDSAAGCPRSVTTSQMAIQRPLLADPDLKPSEADITGASPGTLAPHPAELTPVPPRHRRWCNARCPSPPVAPARLPA